MLRHIVSVSLTMTACAAFMPTKANAATLTVTPVGTLEKKVGDSIEFIFTLKPDESETINGNIIRFLGLDFKLNADELLLSGLTVAEINTIVDRELEIARLTANLLKDVKNVSTGISRVGGSYQDNRFPGETFIAVGVVEAKPVPEPLTIFGTATRVNASKLS